MLGLEREVPEAFPEINMLGALPRGWLSFNFQFQMVGLQNHYLALLG